MATLGSNVTRAIGITSLYIQQRWSRDIQQPFDKELQAAKLVQDRSGEAPEGNVLNIPFVGGLNSRAKAASTAITYDSPDAAPVTLNIDKHYYVGVLIEDIVKIQASYDLKAAFQARMAEALARQVDTDLMNLYSGAGTTVAGGATITDASMLAVTTAFDVANTPTSERYGIVGHNTKADLLGINKYVAYDQTGLTGQAVNGTSEFTGSIYGMQLRHSGNVQVNTGVGYNLFFHKRAISLIQQKAPTFEMEYSVDYIGWKTVLYTVYGVGIERAAQVIALSRTTAA